MILQPACAYEMGIFNQDFTLKYTSGSSLILLEIHSCAAMEHDVGISTHICGRGQRLKAILAKLHRGCCRWTQILSVYTDP